MNSEPRNLHAIASNSCLDILTLPTNVITASLFVVCNAFHGLLIRGVAIGTKVIKATGSRPQPIRSFVSRRCRSHAPATRGRRRPRTGVATPAPLPAGGSPAVTTLRRRPRSRASRRIRRRRGRGAAAAGRSAVGLPPRRGSRYNGSHRLRAHLTSRNGEAEQAVLARGGEQRAVDNPCAPRILHGRAGCARGRTRGRCRGTSDVRARSRSVCRSVPGVQPTVVSPR